VAASATPTSGTPLVASARARGLRGGAGAFDRLHVQLALMAPAPGVPPPPRLTDLLVDALGVGLVGRSTALAQIVESVTLGGVAVWDRAWRHGTAMHALDYDDTHEPSLCHSGTAILPGLLAVGVERDRSGAEVLSAFDYGLRVVQFLSPFGPRINEMGMHSTGIVGSLAAAAAVAWLVDGDPQTAADAMEIAAVMAAGLGASFGTDTKPVQAARAGEAGTRAAILASLGLGPPRQAVFGERGLFALLLGGDPSAEVAWGDDNRGAVDQVALKPYPSCFLTHSTIDAVRELTLRLSIAGAGDVDHVAITVHPITTGIADKTDIATANDTKFSLRYCSLATIAHGSPTIDSFTEETWRRLLPTRSAWRSWVDRFTVVSDSAVPRLASRVVMTMTDGRRDAVEVVEPHGSASHPLSRDEVDAKFRANAADILSVRDIETCLASLHAIADVPGLRDLPSLRAVMPPYADAA
jgi:2-methylcitrate dehydratase PrpD